MEQTAVEYLEKYLTISLGIDRMRLLFNEFEKAKEMEKQQIIDAHGSKLKNSRRTSNFEYWYTGEEYYNETFKNK